MGLRMPHENGATVAIYGAGSRICGPAARSQPTCIVSILAKGSFMTLAAASQLHFAGIDGLEQRARDDDDGGKNLRAERKVCNELPGR
jgi:hypothetical protein